MITEIAAAIVAEMKVNHGVYDVRTFPENPASYRLLNQHGALLVSYAGRRWTEPTANVPRHVREIDFDVGFLKKNLAKEGPEEGVQDLLDAVATELAGFEAEGFVFFPIRDDFVSYRSGEGSWYYSMRLTGHNKKLLSQLPIR